MVLIASLESLMCLEAVAKLINRTFLKTMYKAGSYQFTLFYCEAIKGACQEVALDHLTGLLTKIQFALTTIYAKGVVAEAELAQKVTEKMCNLLWHKSEPKVHYIKNGNCGIIGGQYEVETGQVRFFNSS